MTSSTAGRKETERTKLIQEKCQTLLTQMLRDEDNKYCVDCDAKGPRWASWNLGVFLCIRCAGIHRNLGVHISRVKSVNLDTWTPEQVISLQQMGNSRARAVYEAQLPDGFRRPQTDSALESFIRAKYEHKKYLAREWVPPSPPKVDWAKEIDEELERQKRKKKAAQAGAAIGLGVLSSSSSNAADNKKSNINNTSSTNAKSVSLPAPLSKPKSSHNNVSGSSPKTQRISNPTNSTAIADANQSNDLLGLTSPTKGFQTSSNNVNSSAANDSFSGFLSAPSSASAAAATTVSSQQQQSQMDVLNGSSNSQANSLAKEEEDFFNQGSLTGNGTGEKDASGKLTKDSILALYGSAPKQPTNAHMNFAGQTNVGNAAGMYGVPGAYGAAANNFMNATPAQHQFMTPPNSTSLYNTPVMTAPAAFSAPGMSAGGMQQMGGGLNFATQFPVQGMATNFGGMSGAAPSMMNMNGGGGGLVGSGNPLMTTATMAANMNLMQTNQSLISGLALPTMQPQQQQPQQTMPLSATMGMNSFPMSAMGMNMNMGMGMGMGSMVGMPNSPANAFQTTPNANTTTNPNLNQQFGNLNIGNVWQ